MKTAACEWSKSTVFFSLLMLNLQFSATFLSLSLVWLLKYGKSGWRSGHQWRLPPVPQMLHVGWVSVDLNLTARVFSGHSSFSLLKIDSQSNPSGCAAALRGYTWVVFRGRAPSRQHSSFGPTSLSCVLRESVNDCEKGRLAIQISSTPALQFCSLI